MTIIQDDIPLCAVLLQGSSSPLDVCPGVVPPAGGHYVQPVAVDRALTLHTRNLPAPVS